MQKLEDPRSAEGREPQRLLVVDLDLDQSMKGPNREKKAIPVTYWLMFCSPLYNFNITQDDSLSNYGINT